VTAAAEISTARARFDTLLILSSILMCVHRHTSVRLIAELLVRDVVFLDRGYRVSTRGSALAAPAPTIRRLTRSCSAVLQRSAAVLAVTHLGHEVVLSDCDEDAFMVISRRGRRSIRATSWTYITAVPSNIPSATDVLGFRQRAAAYGRRKERLT